MRESPSITTIARGLWAMLVLAGGGLYPGHFTMELIEVLRDASIVLVETYTMPNADWLVEEVRKYTGGRVVAATRSMLEEGLHQIVSEAAGKIVVVVTAGDPLIATTHKALLHEASKRGVEYRILHGISGVCSAKTDSGLDYYKYGRTITIPGPWRGVRAYSVLWYTYSNMCTGLHTLLLLDVDENGGQLSPRSAAAIIMGLEDEVGPKILTRTRVLVIWDSGLSSMKVESYTIEGLSKVEEKSRGIASIIVPGSISPVEAELLESMHGIKLNPADYRQVQEEACSALDRLKDYIIIQ